MSEHEKYTIDIQPLGDGRFSVSVPKIGAVEIIASTKRDDAIEAAHNMIIDYLLKQREISQVKAS